MPKYQKNLKKYLNDIAAKRPAPGGGSAAALSFCLGLALIEKAMNYSLNKSPSFNKEIFALKKLRNNIAVYINKDGEIFEKFMKAQGRGKLYFLKQSNHLIQNLGNACIKSFCLVKKVESGIKKSIISDFYIGLYFVKLSLKACILNLKANSRTLGKKDKHIAIFTNVLKGMDV